MGRFESYNIVAVGEAGVGKTTFIHQVSYCSIPFLFPYKLRWILHTRHCLNTK
jgi:ATP-dependent Clp protease ATP-binding subunit ClpA